MFEEIKEIISDSDMILIGLGEEFNDISFLKKNTDYSEGRQLLEERGLYWLLPAYEQKCRSMLTNRQDEIKTALCKLAEGIQNKNYFVVSVSVNDMIAQIPWKEGRLVMPCGGSRMKQCSEGCNVALQELTEADREVMAQYMEHNLRSADADLIKNELHAEGINLGKCPECGKPLILNNIYAEHYDEAGYLSQWQLYTKWLQGTLNKKVLILELGVGLKFPSVVRWPFEKIAYFNQKAVFYRVNENLYQMSEELKDKGVPIAKNSIDWLLGM